ncbi:MAG: toxin-activating lysine-acyltransferase [Rickettsiales bacterium]|nr:toxin-activating lysine-acyltransferase [Rickettsiales bacterium]
MSGFDPFKYCKPQDWNSGDKIYIMDVITALPAQKEFFKQLQESKFKDQKVHILKPKIDDKGNINGFVKQLLTEVLNENK